MHTQSPKSRNSTPTYMLSPSPSNFELDIHSPKFPHNRARWAHRISQHTPTTIPTPQADFRHSSSLFASTTSHSTVIDINSQCSPMYCDILCYFGFVFSAVDCW